MVVWSVLETHRMVQNSLLVLYQNFVYIRVITGPRSINRKVGLSIEEEA